uniref:Uncharacterized protein n=1 Tax=Aegilops tauschii TaxID=37682 RepID=M8AWD8_AEGTA
MVGKHGAPAAAKAAAASAVPDLEAEDSGSGIVGDNDDGHGVEVEDEDLLYRVPVFDPMLAELYNPMPVDEFRDPPEQKPSVCCFSSLAGQPSSEYASGVADAADGFTGFDVVPDMELASFAADMESLLMGGVEDGFDDLRFLDEEKPQLNLDFDMADFDDQSTAAPAPEQELEDRKRKRSDSGMILKLDYERVIDSWAHDGGSPWFYGERPHIDPSDDSWLDLPAGSRGFGLGAAVTAVTGGEREARVSRYREKRRTRLFAKKIRLPFLMYWVASNQGTISESQPQCAYLRNGGWSRPPKGFVKLNVDAHGLLRGTIGVVIKDDKGKFIVEGNWKIDWCADVMTAKALVLRFDLLLAQKAGCNRLMINSDNMEVIDTMKNR